jgi:hypothetical protein
MERRRDQGQGAADEDPPRRHGRVPSSKRRTLPPIAFQPEWPADM